MMLKQMRFIQNWNKLVLIRNPYLQKNNETIKIKNPVQVCAGFKDIHHSRLLLHSLRHIKSDEQPEAGHSKNSSGINRISV